MVDYQKTIFSLTKKEHEFLKQYAFNQRKSMSCIVREYIDSLEQKGSKKDGVSLGR